MEKDKLIYLGKKIAKIRTSKRVSQLDLSLDADIDRKTISRIENGINEPSLTTLYKISYALNYDFIKEYIDLSLDDYLIFNNTFDILIEKIENKRSFDEEKKIFSQLKNNTTIEYIKTSSQQVELFLESLNDELNAVEKRKLLIDALNSFDNKYTNLEKNSYTNFELRILMNIAMTYRDINNDKYIDLLNFVYKSINKEDLLYPIISINLANAYIYTESNKNCLEILNNAISYSLNSNAIPNPILYFTKSIYERLNDLEYKEDFNKAIIIAELAENEKLIKEFKKSMENLDNYMNELKLKAKS